MNKPIHLAALFDHYRFKTEDLPPELRRQLKPATSNLTALTVKTLQHLGDTATTDELLIAIWRQHRIVIKRIALQNALNRLCNAKAVKRLSTGTWQLVPR